MRETLTHIHIQTGRQADRHTSRQKARIRIKYHNNQSHSIKLYNVQSIQYAHTNNTRVKSFPLTFLGGGRWAEQNVVDMLTCVCVAACVCECIWLYVLCLLSNSETKWKNAITIHSIPFNDYSFHFWRCFAIIYWMCKYKCKHPRTYFVMNWWNITNDWNRKGEKSVRIAGMLIQAPRPAVIAKDLNFNWNHFNPSRNATAITIRRHKKANDRNKDRVNASFNARTICSENGICLLHWEREFIWNGCI